MAVEDRRRRIEQLLAYAAGLSRVAVDRHAREDGTMATVLERREVEQEGISFVLLTGLHATALAVEALPGVAASEISTRLVLRLIEEGVLSHKVMKGLAFRGSRPPDPDATDALVDSYCYVAVKNLQDSAIANAEGFLDEVEAAAPEALAIATFRRLEPKR
jgi:hypothetical protein